MWVIVSRLERGRGEDHSGRRRHRIRPRSGDDRRESSAGPNGLIWITHNGRRDQLQTRPTRKARKSTPKSGKSSNESSIVLAPDGNLWVATARQPDPDSAVQSRRLQSLPDRRPGTERHRRRRLAAWRSPTPAATRSSTATTDRSAGHHRLRTSAARPRVSPAARTARSPTPSRSTNRSRSASSRRLRGADMTNVLGQDALRDHARRRRRLLGRGAQRRPADPDHDRRHSSRR